MQVLLRDPADGSRALMHATSWWNVDTASQNLQDPQKPIWVSLSQVSCRSHQPDCCGACTGLTAVDSHVTWCRQASGT